jgi:hypothetical protein
MPEIIETVNSLFKFFLCEGDLTGNAFVATLQVSYYTCLMSLIFSKSELFRQFEVLNFLSVAPNLFN